MNKSAHILLKRIGKVHYNISMPPKKTGNALNKTALPFKF